MRGRMFACSESQLSDSTVLQCYSAVQQVHQLGCLCAIIEAISENSPSALSSKG